MRQHNDISTQSNTEASQRYKADHRPLCLPSLVAAIVLALGTLSCAFFEIGSSSASGAVATRTAWPTFTPTAASPPVVVALVVESADAAPTLPPPPVNTAAAPVASAATPSPLPTPISTPAAAAEPGQASGSTDTSAASPPSPPADAFNATSTNPIITPVAEAAQPTDTSTPQSTDIPTPTPTTTPDVEDGGWSFANLRLESSEDGLVVYGELINNTGVAQELDVMGGLFYDNQGQVIADDRNMETNWAAEIVSPGGRVPFEVVVNGIQNAANFELNVEAQPIEDP